MENRRIVMWNSHKGDNQKWEIIYVKDMPAEPKKGEMNTIFGFIVESPFHLQTMLPSGRYLDRLGNNVVLKTPNGRNTQDWWFDQRSRTVKNKYQNYSFNIQSNGRSNNLAVGGTNSRWW